LKQKLEEADDTPKNLDIMPMSPPTQALETKDNMEEPEGKEDNTILEATM